MIHLYGWLFVGGLGAWFLRMSLFTQDDNVAILAGLVTTASWGLFAYMSLAVEVPAGTQGLVQRSWPAVTYFAIGLALIGAYIALTGPLAAIGREFSDMKQTQTNQR